MAKLTYISGLNSVIAKMTAAKGILGVSVSRGLKRAGLFLQRESQKIVPVDMGFLHGTADTRNIGGSGFDTDIVVHYGDGVDYAVYVHEDLNARHKPGKSAKYLEKPAREKRKEMIKIIRKG